MKLSSAGFSGQLSLICLKEKIGQSELIWQEGTGKGRRKPPKITSHSDVSSFKGADRLSDLPDDILPRILSALDTKSLVQICSLSKRLGCLWKEVPVLNISCDSFTSLSSFEEHVIKFLSFRSNSAAVTSVNFKGWTLAARKRVRPNYISLFDRVMKYAASHGSLQHLSMSHSPKESLPFDDLAASIKAHHHHHQSLKTLNLKSFSLNLGGGGSGATVFSGFNLLTNLELDDCWLHFPVSNEPFIALPCLKHLKLVSRYKCASHMLKVSGPELTHLQIHHPVDSHCQTDRPIIDRYQTYEVCAPKLESFCIRGYLEQLGQLNNPIDLNIIYFNIISLKIVHVNPSQPQLLQTKPLRN